MKKIFSRQWKTGFDNYMFLLLIALELLMSFTFLGYIHVPPVSITFAYLPVVIAGCLLGPVQSTLLGLIFGLSSMFKATAYYVLPADQIFSPFLSQTPFYSFLLSVGTRTLFGLSIGLLFAFVRKKRHASVFTAIISALAPQIHALLVLIAMIIFFPTQEQMITSAGTINWNRAFQSVLCLLTVELLLKLYHSHPVDNFRFYVEQSNKIPIQGHRIHNSWIIVIFLTLVMTLFSTGYFAQRMAYMLEQHGVELSSVIHHDLLHLQIQFVASMLSLCLIMGLSLSMFYKYLSYRQYLGELDDLTGLMRRRMFFSCYQKDCQSSYMENGYFVFLDIDYFKSINDSMGHPMGDQVLRAVAETLRKRFSAYGKVARIGGDEFALLLHENLSSLKISEELDLFLQNISDILPEYGKITCSIGVSHFAGNPDPQELLRCTDRYLYEAKKLGRNRYVIGEYAKSPSA